jgi:hypothetical protein
MAIRGGWTSSVVHLSAYIYQIKTKLLTATAAQSFFYSLYIICLEVALCIISIPFYLFLQPQKMNGLDATHYHIRRSITLYLLIPLTLLWIVQFGFVVLGNAYANSQNKITIIYSTSTSSLGAVYIPAKKEFAHINTALRIPQIHRLETTQPHSFTLAGTALPHTYVIATLISGNKLFSKMYSTEVRPDGTWNIEHNSSSWTLPAGQYQLLVELYNPATEQKSQQSDPVFFTIKKNWLDFFKHHGSLFINITGMLCALALVLLTLLAL